MNEEILSVVSGEVFGVWFLIGSGHRGGEEDFVALQDVE